MMSAKGKVEELSVGESSCTFVVGSKHLELDSAAANYNALFSTVLSASLNRLDVTVGYSERASNRVGRGLSGTDNIVSNVKLSW
jgi:hypothetical protein